LNPYTQTVTLDLETASACDLSKAGVAAYAEHESTHCYVAVFESSGWDVVWRHDEDGYDQLPSHLLDFLGSGGIVECWNVAFERSIWESLLVPRYGWPKLDPWQWRDAQASACAVNIPPKLEGAAALFELEEGKDMEGAKLMREMTHTERLGDDWFRPMATNRNLDRLTDYCRVDALLTRHIGARVPRMPLSEVQVWLADQEVNHRGMHIDQELLTAMVDVAHTVQTSLAGHVKEISGGELDNATGTPRLKAWLVKQGVTLPTNKDGKETLSKVAVAGMLDNDLTAQVRDVLVARRAASSAAFVIGKLNAVSSSVSRDGRLRHTLQYCAAHTGRWASYGLQVHNLPKGKLTRSQTQLARQAILAKDIVALRMFAGDPFSAMSALLRSLISAPPGYDLIGADYSAIEARVLPWIAGDEAKLDLFRDGVDIYVKAAADVGSDKRQLGKVCELALGYGMGVATFAATAKAWGVDLGLKEARRVQAKWREANPAVVELWAAVETAAIKAIRKPGETYIAGKCMFRMSGNSLTVQLPSGRKLWYHGACVRRAERTVDLVNAKGELESKTFECREIVFRGVDRNKRDMRTETTYSGKLVENISQAIARDILAAALVRLRTTCYNVVVHVHDSAVAEVPEGTGDVEEFNSIVAYAPEWAVGLPLAVDGYRSKHFTG
tara:strand:- start:1796 stop:3802 length:2007 start_codon:yes stop_codon:yes gene_type:complete